MTVALAMSSALLATGGTQEDRLLAARLEEIGVGVASVAWDAELDWAKYSGVLVRSCWDYHLRPEAFFAWLDRLESVGVRVWNQLPLLRWSVDKRYLLDLAARGVPVIPTLVRDRILETDLTGLRETLGTDELIIKPVIGATAHGLERLTAGDGPGTGFSEQGGPWLVQPFVEAIAEEGEWSLMFFAGELSHAVLKRPAVGDFRVQKEWGGSARRAEPAEDFVLVATEALRALEQTPAYARVDLARWQGRPHLMELELIEPELFLEEGDPGLEVLVSLLARPGIAA